VVRRSLFALLLLLATAAAAQVVVEEVGALQESLAQAQRDLQAYRFAPALQALDPVVKTLSEWELAGRLQPSDEALLQKALELRGVAAFNLGKVDAAREDFAHLVRLRPDSALSGTPGAKIQRLFEEVRNSLTGSVALQVEPTDAKITVDGHALTGIPPAQLPLLKGLHLIRVSRPGFDPVEQEVSVEVGTVKPLPVRLVPNARTLYFFVRPEGTELVVDGKPAGRADTRADARPEWAAFLVDGGFAPAEWWAIQALDLPPGDHRVELGRSCYGQKRFLLTVVLDKVNNLPGLIKPIALERRTLTLSVVSRPAGAEVSLDGKSVGTTPVQLPEVCTGEHDLLVQKAGVGEYRARVTLPEESAFEVDANLRPTVAWVGLTRDQETTTAEGAEADAALGTAVRKAATFNGVVVDDRNPLLPDTFFAPGVLEADMAAATEDICRRTGAQALLAGRIVRDGTRFRLTFRLRLPGIAGADEDTASAESPALASEAFRVVDAPLDIVPRDLCLVTVPGARGPVVARGPGGEGPGAGDVLVAADGAPLATPADAAKLFQGRARILLKFLRAGQEKSWLYAPTPLPPVVPYGGAGFSYRRRWLLSRQEILSGEGEAAGLAGRLSAALCSLNLGLPAEALGALDGLSAAPPAMFAAALRPASVAYLRGVALVQLGRVEEARAALQTAAADPDAALDGEGEYPVKPLAADLLAQLPPPPPPPPAAPPR